MYQIFQSGISPILSVFFLFAVMWGSNTSLQARSEPDNDSTHRVENTIEQTDPGAVIQEEELMSVPLDEDGNQKPLTIEEAVRLVMQNSSMLELQKLEVIKSDTDLMREEGKYDPVLGMSYEGGYSISKLLPSTLLQGTKAYQDRYALSVSKLFKTGTYFQAEISDERIDTNSGEGAIAYTEPLFAMLSQPPLHTGALTFVLQQELLQSGFGRSLYKINEMAENQAQINRRQAQYNLSRLVVKTMVDYWNLAIAEERLATARVLLKNTQYIRNITARKLRLGLAESFEMNQWNALLESAHSQVEGALLERDGARIELVRTLNLESGTPLSGATELKEDLPGGLKMEQDIAYALENRPDLQNLRLQKENALLAYRLSENQLLPSVTLGASYSSRDYGRHAHTARSSITEGKYPEAGVQFKVEYPLWNEKARADLRESKVAVKQLTIQEEQLERQIKDEIRLVHRQMETSHNVLQRTRRAVKQTERFYRGILAEYRRGKVQAEMIREALDALAKSRQGLSEAKINYNITLIRYELLKNNIFNRFNIDIESSLEQMEKRIEQQDLEP